ncbi:phosphopantetheine-binding protein, partial [Kitasatospora herbaricolor]
NVFLDALAAHRTAHNLPALSLAWGLWSEKSELTASLSAAELTGTGRAGVVGLSSPEGLSLLDAAQGAGEPLLVPIRFDRTALLRWEDAPPVLRDQVRGLKRAESRAVAGQAASTRQHLLKLPEAERGAALVAIVRSHVATVLGHSGPESVQADRAFKELGFDSLTAVQLRNGLNAVTGLKLPPTVVFDHPTPAALAEHLGNELFRTTQDMLGSQIAEELNRLEAAILSAGSQIGQADYVADRLRALAARLSTPDAGSDDGSADQEIASATADELLDLIDKEFGSV